MESFPELEHLDEDDRRRIVRAAGGSKVAVRLALASVLLGLFGTFLIGGYLWMTCGQSFYVWLVCPFILAVLSAGAYQIRLIMIRGQLRIYLEKAAQRQRLPMCLNCGYDLTGLAGMRCPECGATLPPETHPP